MEWQPDVYPYGADTHASCILAPYGNQSICHPRTALLADAVGGDNSYERGWGTGYA